MTTDPIAAARALIEPLTGYTPGIWEPFFGEAYRVRSDGMTIATAHFVTQLNRIPTKQVAANTALIAAAPDLRDMVATLADALEAERAKVAAAFAMQDAGYSMTTPADAQAALDKLLAEARLEGWRAGRDAAAKIAKDHTPDKHTTALASHVTGRSIEAAIRALPEPMEASYG